MAQPKVKSNLRGVSIPDKIQFLKTVISSLQGNLAFPKAAPLVTQLTAALDLLESQYGIAQMARDASKAQTTLQNQREDTVDGLASDLVNEVNDEANGDVNKLQTSGFPLASAPTPAAKPGPITDFSLTRADNPGEVDGHWHSVANARQYESQIFVGPMPTGPFVSSKSFLKSKGEWTGLQSGSRVWIQLRATGTNGEGPWCDPISLVVP